MVHSRLLEGGELASPSAPICCAVAKCEARSPAGSIPMKPLPPSLVKPNPMLHQSRAPREASNRFLSIMSCVDLEDTAPASSMPKPHCMKKTRLPQKMSQKLSTEVCETAALCKVSTCAWSSATASSSS